MSEAATAGRERDAAGGDEVVAAVDGSAQAGRALEWAVREAGLRGVGLIVAHAYHWPSTGFGALEGAGFLMDALEQDSQEIVQAAEAQARELAPDLAVTTVSKSGPPVPTLATIAAGASVLVTGSRGLGGFAGLLLGSVGTGLVATAPCPVVVVRGERAAGPGDPVVVGVDGSSATDAVLAEAFRSAQRRGCPLEAVHCWQGPSDAARPPHPGGRHGDADAGGDGGSWEGAVSDDLRARIQRVGADFRDVAVSPVVVRGRPAPTLLERAKRAQLVVVGTRGRGEFQGMLLGSTSRAMAQHADCPVLVVR